MAIKREFLSLDYIGGTTSGNRPNDATSAFGTSTLVRGSAGNAVVNLQLALVELGYLPDQSSSWDGAFGSNTEAAVIAFQTWYNGSYPNDKITVDGKVGPATKQRLWNEAGYWLRNNGVAL